MGLIVIIQGIKCCILPFSVLFLRNLPRQVRIHPVPYFLPAQSVAQEKHQFGDGTFGGAVVAADDAGLEQLEAGFVTAHFHGAALALGDVDDDDAAVGGIFQLADEPFFLRGVARAEGFEDDGFQARHMEDGVDDALLDAGKEGEDDHVRVEKIVRLHGTSGVGAADEVLVVADVDACLCQWGIVERAEGVEVLRIDFGGAVAAHQFVFEKDAHFGDDGQAVGTLGGGNLDGGDEVLLAIGAQGADGELRAGEDDGFGKVLEHEAEGGCRVGHGVGAVEDDEAVEVIVVIVYDFDNLCPQRGFHIRGVDGRVELIGGDAVVEAFQLGDVQKQVVEVEVFECTGFGVFYHSDSSSGVNQEDGRVISFHKYVVLILFRAQRYFLIFDFGKYMGLICD